MKLDALLQTSVDVQESSSWNPRITNRYVGFGNSSIVLEGMSILEYCVIWNSRVLGFRPLIVEISSIFCLFYRFVTLPAFCIKKKYVKPDVSELGDRNLWTNPLRTWYGGLDVDMFHHSQREKLGTHGRVPEIYTNIYHLYMGYIMVLWGNMV